MNASNETTDQANAPNVELILGPIFEEPTFENFTNREEREYRKIKTTGADIAFFVLDLLKRGLRQEPSLSDIAKTQLWSRSSEAERRALLVACSDSPATELSEAETNKLRRNDQMLADFIDRRLVNRDFQNRVLSIPTRLEERRRFDEKVFPFAALYASPKIFG